MPDPKKTVRLIKIPGHILGLRSHKQMQDYEVQQELDRLRSEYSQSRIEFLGATKEGRHAQERAAKEG